MRSDQGDARRLSARIRKARTELTGGEWGRLVADVPVHPGRQRGRVDHLRRLRDAAPLRLPGGGRQQRAGSRARGRHHGVVPRLPACLRRRPYLLHRQHHPQADGRRQAAARHRVLLLLRPLHGRGRGRRRHHDRRAGRLRRGGGPELDLRDSGRRHRDDAVGRLPVPDRGAEPDRAGRHLQGLPRDAERHLRRGGTGSPTPGARADVPLLRPVHEVDQPHLAAVLRRPRLRHRLRHHHRGPAAGGDRLRRHPGAARTTPCSRCRCCSPAA